ncbi:MAG: hypothetical protein NTW06_00235 [Candidatus Falkowbacteria bacterium]|nr:hypothetical protein [Candidatus Falkowbacteria bacterium]
MKTAKTFEEYVKDGTIKRASKNGAKAKFLIEESQNSLEGLKERIEQIGINNKNANSIIKDCYDILMELVRANLLLRGYNSSGYFAHEAEVSYLAKLKFPDEDVSFLNEVRFFRNSITYYGKILDKEYAEKVYAFLKKIYPELKKMTKM